ncbi:intermediate filament protein IF-D [Ciona intestinalis]
MASKQGRSSYRNTFGSQTAYSTAGSKGYSKSFVMEEPVAAKRVSYSYSASSSGGGASATNLDLGGLKLNEKETLNGINNRFASYIEKVRYLEEQNSKLDKRIREASARKTVDLGEDKLQKLRRLRAQVDEATLAKVRSEIARDNLRGEASEIKWKLEHEGRLRSELDDELGRLRKDVDDATMVRVDLERKIETLREELEYGKKLHAEEIDDLKAQVRDQGVNVEVDGIAPDVAELLRQIRAQYESIVLKNKDEAEQWYKNKFEDLEERAKVNVEDMEKVRGDINDYRKQVTQLEMELESLRGTNDYLERNLADVEKRYEVEAARYQSRVAQLGSARYQSRVAQLGSEFELHKGKKRCQAITNGEKVVNAVTDSNALTDTIFYITQLFSFRVSSSSSSSDDDDEAYQTKTTKKVIVKTIETRDGKIVSSSISEKQLLEDKSDSSSSSSSSSDEE